MLTLICGPSGAGKTEYLTQRIQEDITKKRRSYLLVPEQQAYISERDIPVLLPQNAGLYFEIISFSSLCDRLFHKYGGAAFSSPKGGLSSVLMWDTLRTLSPFFRRYQNSAGPMDSAFTALMLSTMSELRAAGIQSEDLEKTAAELPDGSPLQKKLLDLALISAAYKSRMEECFGADPGDRLIRAAELLEKHSFFEDAHIYIDSFTSFTAEEYRVIKALLQQSQGVHISLCTDHPKTAMPHFKGVSDTAYRLKKLANEANTEIDTVILERKHCKKPPELVVLERDLWNFSAPITACPKNETSSVRLIAAANQYEEAEAIALNILELKQNGVDFGNIAVVVRDTETYRGVLDAAMERHNIPYFLSERVDLSQKPLARLVLSALRAVSRGFCTRDILTLIKTGFAGVDLREGSLFEEYCETWHISGKRFFDDVWSMNPDGLTTTRSARADDILASANRVRKTVILPLTRLEAKVRMSKSIQDFCNAIYTYINELNLPEQLSARAKEELMLGNRREAGESVRLYRFFCEALSSLCKYLPDAEVTADEFLTLIGILFSNADMGSVPNLQDCVMIGSAATLRVENVRAAFLAGLCEGEFPRAATNDGILTENDKEILSQYGLVFDSRENVRFSEELFYVYRAMSKAKEFLYLSTVLKQADGSGRAPSLAFARAKLLLSADVELFDRSAVEACVGAMPCSLTDTAPLALPPKKGVEKLSLSQSKIQAFALCPYRYYATYQLKLREKKDCKPSYADDGTFLHYVFEHFLRAAHQNGKFVLPINEEIPTVAERIVEEYLNDVCPIAPQDMDAGLLHLFSRLSTLAVRLLIEITGELRASRFVPTYFEKVIGLPGENGFPPMMLTLNNGSLIKLTGKIDRIDLFEHEDKMYVRIVDYKSGKHTFSPKEVKSGMDIQLILYLSAAIAADPKLIPSGAQYLYSSSEGGRIETRRSGFLLEDEMVLSAADATPTGEYTKKLLHTTQEEIKALENDMQEAVKAIATRILAGEAEKTPSPDACKFCPILQNCDRAVKKR